MAAGGRATRAAAAVSGCAVRHWGTHWGAHGGAHWGAGDNLFVGVADLFLVGDSRGVAGDVGHVFHWLVGDDGRVTYWCWGTVSNWGANGSANGSAGSRAGIASGATTHFE